MNIDLNTQVTVTLTPRGVKIVTEANLKLEKQMVALGVGISNAYKIEGDQLTDTLWEIIQLFAPHCSIGMEVPFTDLREKDQTSAESLTASEVLEQRIKNHIVNADMLKALEKIAWFARDAARKAKGQS